MEADNERGVTREALEQRLAELGRQRRQAFANYNALHGAVQECEYWLSVLAKKKPPKKADKNGKPA